MGIAGLVGASGDIRRSLAALIPPVHSGAAENVSLWELPGCSLGICGDAIHAFCAEQPECLLLLEGRIHDRSGLLQKLDIPSRPILDADLMLKAYLRFGEDLAAHVTGEFSFAVWDTSHRRLILGCDAIGARAMYYWHNGSTLRFAPEVHGLLACPEVAIAPDDTQAALWLMRCPGLGERTLFKDIQRVPAGHVLIVEDGRLRLHRYWQPENVAPLHLADAREYAMGLLHHMQQAVECRIPAGESVGMQLSGGLDSSTVTALAGKSLARQGRRATAFTAVPVNAVGAWLSSERFADERLHAASVIERYPNLDHVLVPNNAVPLFQALDSYSDARLTPIINPLNSPWLLGIDKEAQRRGIRILLRATAGNLTASYRSDPYVLAGMLTSGRLFDWCRLVIQRNKYGFSLKQSLDASLRFSPMRRWFHAWRRQASRTDALRMPSQSIFATSAIHAGFLQEQNLPLQLLHDTYDQLTNSRLDRLQGFARLDRSISFAGSMRSSGIELTDPMSDRRLVEYCLSVPDEVFSRNGCPRSLIRDAMEGGLPDLVRNEYRRGKQAADAASMLAENRAEIADEVCRMASSDLANRYLDMPALIQLIAGWPSGDWPNATAKQHYEQKLMRGVSFGRFIRRMEDGSLYSSFR